MSGAREHLFIFFCKSKHVIICTFGKLCGMCLIERSMNAVGMTSPLSKKPLISFPEENYKSKNVISQQYKKKLSHNFVLGIIFFRSSNDEFTRIRKVLSN